MMKLTPKLASVVIDSNVWISALVFGGNPRKVVESCVSEGVLIILSAEIMTETRRILNQKFPDFSEYYEALLTALDGNLHIVSLGVHLVEVCRDPDDNQVIETALAADANIIVSGDKDLLTLRRYQNIHIVTPSDFIKDLV